MLEPIKPIPNFVYRCDSSFYLESLKEMLDVTRKYGFIIVDGSGALFATLAGNTQTILARYGVTLPKKHRKGGQSSVRFARLREEARHNYVSKVNEMAVKCFISDDNKVNIEGLVLAGSADFKDQLKNRLDPRLQGHVLAVVDVSYGFNQGLNQAIELSSGILKDVQLVKQKKILSKFFEEISLDSGKYCYGFKDTLTALESGAVQTLLVHDKLDIIRYEATDGQNPKVIFEKGDKEPKELAGEKLEIVDSTPLIDWLAEHYREFGCRLEIVVDSSAEGSQFCKGFGGIGAILRYAVALGSDEVDEEVHGKEEDEDDLSEYFGNENGKEESEFGF